VRVNRAFPLTLAVRTDTGLVRTNNEDSYGSAWMPDGSLFVIVADGMGGHAAGEVASRMAVEVIEVNVREDPDGDPRARLYHAIIEANEAIIQEGKRTGRRGMGTTTVTAIVRGEEAWLGQVGDSRLFHVRRGQVLWRTLDHTRVQSLLDRGIINESEARSHPDAGMLTRALGHAKTSNGAALEPDVMQEPLRLQPGDALVLSSDGLHDLVEDWEVAMAVAGCTPDDAADALLRMALQRGGHDNVTVAIVVAGERALPYEAEESEPDEASVLPTSDLAGLHPASSAPALAIPVPTAAGAPGMRSAEVRDGVARGGTWLAPATADDGASDAASDARWMWLIAAAGITLMGVSVLMLLIAMALAFG
jgi:serine/threonine protein phosphatase PrpC